MPSSRTMATSKTILIALMDRFVIISYSKRKVLRCEPPTSEFTEGANSFNLRRTNEDAKHAPPLRSNEGLN